MNRCYIAVRVGSLDDYYDPATMSYSVDQCISKAHKENADNEAWARAHPVMFIACVDLEKSSVVVVDDLISLTK